MKESFWAVLIFILGITSIFLIYFFQTVTNTSEHNYELLRETTEAAMFDALDLAAYRKDETIRIDQERFVDSFIRRFAQDATLAHEYNISIYDVHEEPPKVSIKIDTFDIATFSNPWGGESDTTQGTLINRIDAILETKYTND
jgi:hypothetical protein